MYYRCSEGEETRRGRQSIFYQYAKPFLYGNYSALASVVRFCIRLMPLIQTGSMQTAAWKHCWLHIGRLWDCMWSGNFFFEKHFIFPLIHCGLWLHVKGANFYMIIMHSIKDYHVFLQSTLPYLANRILKIQRHFS